MGGRLGQLLAGHFPDGVVSLVNGDGPVGAELAAAPVDVVAHVGSTATGRAIAAACARTGAKALPDEDVAPAGGFLRWVDRLLSR